MLLWRLLNVAATIYAGIEGVWSEKCDRWILWEFQQRKLHYEIITDKMNYQVITSLLISYSFHVGRNINK